MSNLFTTVDELKELELFAIEAGWKPILQHEIFLNAYNSTLKLENPNMPTKPGFIRPSSLTSCVRKLTFEYLAEDEEFAYDGSPRIGESGTDAHARIQDYIMKMKNHGYDIEFVSVKDYLSKNPNPDLEIIDESAGHMIIESDIEKNRIMFNVNDKEYPITMSLTGYMERYRGPETLVYNKKTHSRFKTDGIIRIGSEYLILEIKTENNRKYGSHNKTLEVHDKHKLQGTFYGISFGINKVMFLYENRDTCATFVTVLDIDEVLRNKVLGLIRDTIKYGELKAIAPRTFDKL